LPFCLINNPVEHIRFGFKGVYVSREREREKENTRNFREGEDQTKIKEKWRIEVDGSVEIRKVAREGGKKKKC